MWNCNVCLLSVICCHVAARFTPVTTALESDWQLLYLCRQKLEANCKCWSQIFKKKRLLIKLASHYLEPKISTWAATLNEVKTRKHCQDTHFSLQHCQFLLQVSSDYTVAFCQISPKSFSWCIECLTVLMIIIWRANHQTSSRINYTDDVWFFTPDARFLPMSFMRSVFFFKKFFFLLYIHRIGLIRPERYSYIHTYILVEIKCDWLVNTSS